MKERVNALITVSSVSALDGDTDNIEMLVGGRFTATEDGYEIVYDETDPETSDVTHTVVSIVVGGRITVNREGGVNTQMIFEKGKQHLVYYDTSFGALLVGISTHRISLALDKENGGTVEVDYALEIDSQIANEIQLSLKVEPSPKQSNA